MNVEGYIGIAYIQRNGDKTHMQSTHYSALGFIAAVMTYDEQAILGHAIQALYC